jgi:hypothetical protein
VADDSWVDVSWVDVSWVEILDTRNTLQNLEGTHQSSGRDSAESA